MFEDIGMWLLGGTFFGIVLLGGIYVIIQHINKMYPPISILYFDRGTMAFSKGLRTKGDLIIDNGYVQLLLGQANIKGCVSNHSFFLLKGKKVYLAYLRRGVFFGLQDHISNEILESDKKPVIIIQRDGSLAGTFSDDKSLTRKLKGKATISDNFLMPVHFAESNASLEEVEIKTGRDIANRFVQGILDSERDIQSNSPIMAIIIAWLPAAILITLVGFMFWLTMAGLGNNATLIAQSNAQTTEALASLARALGK